MTSDVARDSAKLPVFGVDLDPVDYAEATNRIMQRARARESYAVSALAVHGLMEAEGDDDFRQVVNEIDLVTPDGQPVKWALNILHGADLADRCYGPNLTWEVLAACAEDDISVFLFGSKQETCDLFEAEIKRRFPAITIAGVQSDRFRDASAEEDAADIRLINASGAGVVLVGRGCPRQERWVHAHRGSVNAAMLAVGAAFDYGAGNMSEPPAWMQRAGLQWLYRLVQEPGRLWKRYLVTNSAFIGRLVVATYKKRRP